MDEMISRRSLLVHAGTGIGTGILAGCVTGTCPAEENGQDGERQPFRFCLNTGTISGHKLSLVEEVEVTARAGYSGIEPWIRKLREYTEQGNSLDDLRKRISDLGLTIESAIGFPRWAVDDDEQRRAALDEFKRDMDMLSQIGGTRIAAPPAGINRTPGMDLAKIAERYRAVLELGREMQVIPQLEIWGSAQTLGRVGEAALVAIQANDPDACLLLDAFHLYKGGSGFDGLRLLNGAAMHVFHINDYPADPPRDQINDSHRVYPGDGVCPLGPILRDLYQTGFRGALSLELFNRDYWQQDVQQVARTGLEKTQEAAEKAMP